VNRIETCLDGCHDSKLRTILEAGAAAALAAGQILKARFGKVLEVRHKGKNDLVTEADLAAEEAVLDILERRSGGAVILSEESRPSGDALDARQSWIVDPLDGTTNFAHGYPWFGVSVAFLEHAEVLAGVIYCPPRDELFCACRGHGAWMNGSRIHTSDVGSLSNALVATGFPYDIHEAPDPVLAALKEVLTRAQGVRRAGSAALDLASVACGRLDGFWEMKLKPWDTAAGMLLLTEAEGRITDFKSRDFSPFMAEVLATNSHIHGQLAPLLAPFSGRKH